MKRKKIIIIVLIIILVGVYIIYLSPIPKLENDIFVVITYKTGSSISAGGYISPNELAPDCYIITKDGKLYEGDAYKTSVYKDGKTYIGAGETIYEKEEFIRFLNIFERLNIKKEKQNENSIYKICKGIEKSDKESIIIEQIKDN